MEIDLENDLSFIAKYHVVEVLDTLAMWKGAQKFHTWTFQLLF